MGPIFNEKINKKWNLWVRKQCIYALFTAESNRKVNICGYCKTPTRVKTKKKKKEQKRKVENVEYKHILFTLLKFILLQYF